MHYCPISAMPVRCYSKHLADYVGYFQVYPTTVRALGLGTCNVMSRFSALVAPFLSQVIKMARHFPVAVFSFLLGSD